MKPPSNSDTPTLASTDSTLIKLINLTRRYSSASFLDRVCTKYRWFSVVFQRLECTVQSTDSFLLCFSVWSVLYKVPIVFCCVSVFGVYCTKYR